MNPAAAITLHAQEIVDAQASPYEQAIVHAQGDRGAVTGGAREDPLHPSRKHDTPGLRPSYARVAAARPMSGQPSRRERRAQAARVRRVARDVAREAARP